MATPPWSCSRQGNREGSTMVGGTLRAYTTLWWVTQEMSCRYRHASTQPAAAPLTLTSNWPGGLLSLLQQPDLSARIVFWTEPIDYGLTPALSPLCQETQMYFTLLLPDVQFSDMEQKQTWWMGINNNHFLSSAEAGRTTVCFCTVL